MIVTSDFFTRKQGRNTTLHDNYLLENKGICPAILADMLHVTERFVIQRQRRLGLRKLTGNKRKGERHDD